MQKPEVCQKTQRVSNDIGIGGFLSQERVQERKSTEQSTAPPAKIVQKEEIQEARDLI